jgi:hypothetical protein
MEAQTPALETAIVQARAGALQPMDVLDAFHGARVFLASATPTDGDVRELSPLRFETPDGPMIAVFTRLDLIRVFGPTAPYALELTGWQVVDLLPQDAGVVINPRHDVGYQFPPFAIGILRTRMADGRRAAAEGGTA